MIDLLTTAQKTALGSVVYRSGELEHTIDWMFLGMLKVQPEVYKTMTEYRMLAWKLDAFKELGLSKVRTKANRERFAEIMDELKGLNERRNTAVHGQWLPDGPDMTLSEALGLGPMRPAVARGRRRGALKAEELENLATRLETAQKALSHFFVQHWIRPIARRSIRRSKGKGKGLLAP
jgi:hypothetical protein